jgi:hypothetical protein
MADRPLLCGLMGAAALAMDLGFIAALASARARRLLVPAALGFHLVILVTLNYAFLGAPLLLTMVDWSKPAGRPAQPSSGSAGSSTSAGSASGVTASPS